MPVETAVRETSKSGMERGAPVRTRGSDSQTLATLRAAPCENLTSSSRCHPGAKAVRAFTMQVTRLICTLHAGSRREKCAKTSTWWAEKKGGKGTQRLSQCQAQGTLSPSEISRVESLAGLWITRGATV